jgi:hypothetical protein
MKFTRNDTLPSSGSSFLKRLDGITNETIQSIFGDLPINGGNPSIKYSNDIRILVKGEIFTIYSVWGVWRIGGYSDENQLCNDLFDFIINFQINSTPALILENNELKDKVTKLMIENSDMRLEIASLEECQMETGDDDNEEILSKVSYLLEENERLEDVIVAIRNLLPKFS